MKSPLQENHQIFVAIPGGLLFRDCRVELHTHHDISIIRYIVTNKYIDYKPPVSSVPTLPPPKTSWVCGA